MKKFAIITLLISMLFGEVFSQKLNKKDNTYLKNKVNEIVNRDQKHRWQLMYGVIDEKDIDSIQKLPSDLEHKRILNALKGEVGFDSKTRDSLQNLQNILDSINYVELIPLIKKYGFPSYKRVKIYGFSSILLHYIDQEKFTELLPILRKELEKGNLAPLDFAQWFDRCQINMGKKQLYGEYDTKYPCVENLEDTNIERKKIGLEILNENRCK